MTNYKKPGGSRGGGGSRRGSFAGLEALIREEKTAAAGMSSVGRAGRDASRALAQIATAARDSINDAGKASRPADASSGGGGSPSISASVGGDSGVGALGGSIGQVGEQVSILGVRMRAVLVEALAPLNSIETRLAGQFNRVGGTVTEMARRVDASMKFPKFREFLTTIVDGFKQAGELSKNPAVRLRMHFLAAAASIYRAFAEVRNYISSAGDVAKSALDKVGASRLGKVAADARNIASGLRSVSPAANAAIVSVRGLGREIAVSLGFYGLVYKATSALSGFFTGGISGAIGLAETVSAAEATFGRFTGVVKAQAEAMAGNFGTSKQAQLDIAAGYGEMAMGAGYAQGEAAKFANTFTALAADLASRKYIPFDEAAAKIQSALAGQSEPLRRFGVLIDEDAVKAYALAHGLAASDKAISHQAEMASRAALILNGLATTQGDLARTAGSAANQFRKAGGGLANFGVEIGNLLLPAVQSGITAFNDLLSSVLEVFEANRSTFQGWADAVKAAMDAVGVAVRNAGAYWTILKLKVVEACSNMLSWIGVLPENLARFADWLGNNWLLLIGDAFDAAGAVVRNFAENLANLGTAIGVFLSDPTQGFRFQWTPLLEGFRATAAELPEILRPALLSMQKEIDEQFRQIAASEKARHARVVGPPKGRLAPLGDPDKAGKDKGPQFAALAEAGSKESYSAIIRHERGGGSEDNARRTARAGEEAVKIQQRMDQKLAKLALVSGVFTL